MRKQKLFRTARATIGCAAFAAGEVVSVEYTHTALNGNDLVDWYRITGTAHGPLDYPVAYPSHHLTRFCL